MEKTPYYITLLRHTRYRSRGFMNQYYVVRIQQGTFMCNIIRDFGVRLTPTLKQLLLQTHDRVLATNWLSFHSHLPDLIPTFQSDTVETTVAPPFTVYYAVCVLCRTSLQVDDSKRFLCKSAGNIFSSLWRSEMLTAVAINRKVRESWGFRAIDATTK